MTEIEISDVEEVRADWEKTDVGDVLPDPRPLIGPTFTELDEAYTLNDKYNKIRDLKALADFLAANPDLPFPRIEYEANVWDEDDFKKIIKHMPGNYEKDYQNDYFRAKKPLTNTLTYSICTYREAVCEKVQVGEEEVEEYDFSNVPKKKVKKPIYEYKCQPLLGD